MVCASDIARNHSHVTKHARLYHVQMCRTLSHQHLTTQNTERLMFSHCLQDDGLKLCYELNISVWTLPATVWWPSGDQSLCRTERSDGRWNNGGNVRDELMATAPKMAAKVVIRNALRCFTMLCDRFWESRPSSTLASWVSKPDKNWWVSYVQQMNLSLS